MMGTEDNPRSWVGLAEWWLQEVASDPAYHEVVTPLLVRLLQPMSSERFLDIGCGEGRVMASVAAAGAAPVGLDIDIDLLERAMAFGPVFRASLPSLAPVGSDTFDGAYVCLVLEHLEGHGILFAEAARVVLPEGRLVVVLNHPIFTAPDSAPIDDADGETLWRPGRYFDDGFTDEPAGAGTVRFHHRSMAGLLNSAARAGWALDEMVELGVTEDQVQRTPALADQRNIPRLLGCRWINHSGKSSNHPMQPG